MSASTYQQIAHAIDTLRANPATSLAQLAAQAQMSEGHFQRLFARWAGVSPKRFGQFLQRQSLQRLLAGGDDLLSLAADAGLSGPGRLHDLVVTCDAVTPAELRRGGAGVVIDYGCGDTPFGPALVGVTERGICYLEFLPEGDSEVSEGLQQSWPQAQLRENPVRIAHLLQQAFPGPDGERQPLHLYLRGSNFQLRVWQALLSVPAGRLTSYAQLARLIDSPRAARAVGSAVAANPVGYLIPCHRVIRAAGEIGEYCWGSTRKAALIGCELAVTADCP